MRGDAVDEGCAGDIDPLAAAGDANLGRRLQHLDRGQGSARCSVITGTDGAAKPIQESTVGLVVYRIRPSFGGMVGDKLGQDLGNGRGMVVCDDGGIGGHKTEVVRNLQGKRFRIPT
jgi:hypothetical protein